MGADVDLVVQEVIQLRDVDHGRSHYHISVLFLEVDILEDFLAEFLDECRTAI